MCKKVICFDLDDTLYKEIDFLKSGYRKIADHVEKRYGLDASDVYDRLLSWYRLDENPFVNLNKTYEIEHPISDYLNIYRYHHPNLSLSNDTIETLNALQEEKVILAIITDGREVTQMQKIEALGLTKWFRKENIFINEDTSHFKPSHWSFDRLMLHCSEQCPEEDLSYYYVGDNPQKDFLAPNQLGWETVCLLDDGRNIHGQDFGIMKGYNPKYCVGKINDIIKMM